MAKEALIQIQEAETSAKDLVDNARVQAEKIVDNAVREAEDGFSRLIEQCKLCEAAEKETAEKNAQAMSGEFEKQTRELCDDLTRKLLPQKSKAVDMLIEIIMD